MHPRGPKPAFFLFLALGLALTQGPSPGRFRGSDPLSGLRSLARALSQGDSPAEERALLEVLGPLTLDPEARRKLRERWAQLPPLETGVEVLRAERGVAEKLQALSARERLLLWEVCLDPSISEGVRSRILRLLDASLPDPLALVRVLKEAKGGPRWEAAIRLGRKGGPVAKEALLQAAREDRGWGRQYSLVGLVLAGAQEAVPVFYAALEDTSPAVRRHALLGLGELGSPAELAGIQPFRDDGSLDASTRLVAKAAMNRLQQRFPVRP